MTIETRLFGTVTIEDEKLIVFPDWIIGFPYMKKFVLIRDEENEEAAIMWLQSMEEPQFAMPVVEPHLVVKGYNPVVDDEHLLPLGGLKEENTYSLVTITVPAKIEKMTANLKAPIVINMENNRAVQLIVEDEYEVKHPIYETLRKRKESIEC